MIYKCFAKEGGKEYFTCYNKSGREMLFLVEVDQEKAFEAERIIGNCVSQAAVEENLARANIKYAILCKEDAYVNELEWPDDDDDSGPDEENGDDEDSPFRKLWLRLGVAVFLTKEEEQALLERGDPSVLRNAVYEGRFKIGGETYVPDSSMLRYDEKYGTSYGDGDTFHIDM